METDRSRTVMSDIPQVSACAMHSGNRSHWALQAAPGARRKHISSAYNSPLSPQHWSPQKREKKNENDGKQGHVTCRKESMMSERNTHLLPTLPLPQLWDFVSDSIWSDFFFHTVSTICCLAVLNYGNFMGKSVGCSCEVFRGLEN